MRLILLHCELRIGQQWGNKIFWCTPLRKRKNYRMTTYCAIRRQRIGSQTNVIKDRHQVVLLVKNWTFLLKSSMINFSRPKHSRHSFVDVIGLVNSKTAPINTNKDKRLGYIAFEKNSYVDASGNPLIKTVKRRLPDTTWQFSAVRFHLRGEKMFAILLSSESHLILSNTTVSNPMNLVSNFATPASKNVKWLVYHRLSNTLCPVFAVAMRE